MESSKSGGLNEEPILESESFRIWKARPGSDEEHRRMKEVSLAVGDGEKVHEVLILDLGDGQTVKLLSKERMEDGLVNVLMKAEEPSSKVSILRSDDWMTKERYGVMVAIVKEAIGPGHMSVIRGEDIQAGVEQVGCGGGKGSGERAEERGTRSPADRGAPRGPPLNKRGGDSHGG